MPEFFAAIAVCARWQDVTTCRRPRAMMTVSSREAMIVQRSQSSFISRLFVLAVAIVASCLPVAAGAETSVVRISYGFGILYLPLMVMDRERLFEKHAKA